MEKDIRDKERMIILLFCVCGALVGVCAVGIPLMAVELNRKNKQIKKLAQEKAD